MKRLDRAALLVLLTVLGILLSTERPAFAYLDPGSGSYLFQVMVAAALGGVYAMKLGWTKLQRALGRLFSRRR